MLVAIINVVGADLVDVVAIDVVVALRVIIFTSI